ncbi:Sec-independent protein translocase protein TatA [uncultured delta proteobacterium]|uniref:Sec-independent protein translocase protein TatA n=1 Tax=uncultured delta proteobacterium TaxID=34034 RepID=A0A212JMM5_9DELT|nr:Sec-independent protein translocase protein TatA [uncultured delta proteobacterium]
MFGKIGIGQILIIFAVFVIFFGYRKLPELGKGLGKALREFRKSVGGEDEIDITPKAEEKKDESGKSGQ